MSDPKGPIEICVSKKRALRLSVWLGLGVASAFLFTFAIRDKNILWLTIPLLAIFAYYAIIIMWSIRNKKPVVLANRDGIIDTRLGIGLIRWSDIESIKIAKSDEQMGVGIKLKNRDLYLARVSSWKRFTFWSNRLQFGTFGTDIVVDTSILAVDKENLAVIIEAGMSGYFDSERQRTS